MKILFVLHYPPPVHGAAAVGLQIKESKLINSAFNCTYINLGTSLTIDEIGGKSWSKLFRYLHILGKVMWNIITDRPDLCYLTISSKGAPFYKDAIIVWMVKLLRVKLVYHFHNKGVSLNHDRFMDNLLYKFVFNNTKVILLSKFLYSDIRKYVDEDNVYYCPNGIEKSNHELKSNKKNNIPELLFLSNLLVFKGVYVMLDSFVLLRKRMVNFHCTMVGGIGDITEKDLLNKLENLGLKDHVSYVGKKYGIEKDKEFAKSSIFIHPTLDDCFPLVLLEAMQYSLPIVSTFVGGIPEIVEDGVNGYLVAMNDSVALAEKLEMLIQNPHLCVKMGNVGNEKLNSRFVLEIFEQRLKEILADIA